MNIFVTDPCPIQSARNLPDKHIVKMPLETCQMLAIIYSDWYHGLGKLYKKDGTPYATARGAFRNHPCTQWAAANQYNLAWLIRHGYGLCDEYNQRYGKVHTCLDVISQAERIFHRSFSHINSLYHASRKVTEFTRAMPEDIKYNHRISTIEAYKYYLNTKPWLATNYLRIPSRKPSFIITTMTTSLPVYDFSTSPEDRAKEQAAINQAIKDAEAAMKAAPAKRQVAPAVKAVAKKLVPAKKAPAKAKGSKSGRVVGISADENKFLKELLSLYNNKEMDYNAFIESNKAAYTKLLDRYNKH